MQVIFRKRATNHRALSQKMTYTDKASDASSPPCIDATPPKNGVIALWPNTHVVKCKYYVSQKQSGFNNKIQWYSILLIFFCIDATRPIPLMEEIVLQIITTAEISNKFSRESPYISNTISREAPKFPTNFHLSKRSPRHSKDLRGFL